VRWFLPALLIAVCIVGLCAFEQALCQQKQSPRYTIPEDVEHVRDVEFGKGGPRALTLDILRPKVKPKEPMPVIVFVHGGGWRMGKKEGGIARVIPLAQRGYFCVTINYRLSDEAVFPAQIEDCKCAVRFVRARAKEYGVDPDRVGAWGTSAGGHLVALLGTAGDAGDLEGKGGWDKYSSKVQAVCDYFGPTDFMKYIEDAQKAGKDIEEMKRQNADNAISKLLGGPFWEKRDLCRKASPITYVSKDDPPFLICHGDKDELVPLSQSEALRDALKKAGVECTLHVVKGAAHGIRDPESDKRMTAFFDKHLRGGKQDG